MSASPTVHEERPLALARAALARPASPMTRVPARLVVVDVARQRLAWIVDGRVAAEWTVSTAAAGVGGEEGSLRTPPGWHRVHARIGDGEPVGAVFVSRQPTGEVWRGEPRADDLILTRVLTLEGLEPGVNRGPGRDSLERYIYVHGTNHVAELGAPASHGCVRMASDDLLALFAAVAEGDAVLIAGETGDAPA